MKLFKAKEGPISEQRMDTKSFLIVPEIVKQYPKGIVKPILGTILSLGDMEDYNYLLSQTAKRFYMQNAPFFKGLSKISSDDLEDLWDYVNMFLTCNDLGFSQLKVNLEQKKIKVIHYNSIFVELLKGETNGKLCEFYSTLYSLILSEVFETEINMKEEECANQTNHNYCIFSMV